MPRAAPVPRPLLQPAGASQSSSFGGYQAIPTDGLASASVTLTIPKLSCTPKQDANEYTFFSGVATDGDDVYAFVTSYCFGEGPQYVFQLGTPAGPLDETDATAGDVVVASLFESAGATDAEIHDVTNGASWSASDPTNLGDTIVDIGTFSDVGLGRPIPKFGKVSFSNATVNGDYLGFESPTRINTVNGGETQIKTSALHTTGAGSSFTATFERSS